MWIRWFGLLSVAAGARLMLGQAAPIDLPGDTQPAAKLPGLDGAVDLRAEFARLGFAPRQQGGRPTCSVFTVVGAIEFALAKQQGRSPRLSVEFLNWAANQACGDRADGGFFSDLWKGYAASGVCDEDAMPYADTLDPARAPTATALANAKTRVAAGLRLHWVKEWDVNTGLTEAHLAAIQQTLAAGWPVCGGFRWPKSARWVDGVLQMCPADAVYDGHSVLLVGYRRDEAQPGGGVLLFRNSAGDGRDGSMSYEYARAYMNDAAWIDFANQEVGQVPPRAPADQPANSLGRAAADRAP